MDLQESKKAFETYKSKDPFPKVSAALLNKWDVKNYIETVGMICPFHEKDLIGIKYDVRLKGKCIFWTENDCGNREEHVLNIGEEACKEITIEPNSILFVTLEPYFQIPEYIALRYNFKINHVYKGLLLGTGPIVDPGFHGYLSIPIHNLTKNRYVLKANEPLVSIEFTKINPYLDKGKTGYIYNCPNDFDKTKNFPAKESDVSDYIHDALKLATEKNEIMVSENYGILNSIPALEIAIKKSEEAAKTQVSILEERSKAFEETTTSRVKEFKDETKNSIDKFNRRDLITTALTIITLILTVALGTWALTGTLSAIHKERTEYSNTQNYLERSIEDLTLQLDAEKKKNDDNQEKIAKLLYQIELTNKVMLLQNEIEIEKNIFPINQNRINELEQQLNELFVELKALQGG